MRPTPWRRGNPERRLIQGEIMDGPAALSERKAHGCCKWQEQCATLPQVDLFMVRYELKKKFSAVSAILPKRVCNQIPFWQRLIVWDWDTYYSVSPWWKCYLPTDWGTATGTDTERLRVQYGPTETLLRGSSSAQERHGVRIPWWKVGFGVNISEVDESKGNNIEFSSWPESERTELLNSKDCRSFEQTTCLETHS